MKNLLFAALLILSTSFAASAQTPKPRNTREKETAEPSVKADSVKIAVSVPNLTDMNEAEYIRYKKITGNNVNPPVVGR